MTTERWARIKSIVEDVEAAPVSERSAALDRLCQGNATLRGEVEPYLEENLTGTFIPGMIGEQAASLSLHGTGDTAGRQRRFGHYQLVKPIGQGGMGAVYEAVRVDDFHKRVALKIIRQGLDSDFARIRFLQERQLLAALEHPYIARLLDGGESDDGSPYLVMEFIIGEPINGYAAKLDRTGRLRLFLRVCEAVGHAHRNLVIHRDLKPANILVTAAGDPKLLDFGIAKLLDPASTNTAGVMALTPDYASPEQVRGQPISTASDVYSLGVILYQMLTGRRPYTLETASALEMDRVVCTQPPAPPQLGDELDHILLMALRKEPERRYPSVERFAEDLERYLDHRPVRARPDTAWYRMSKYLRRHWVVMLASLLTLTAICAGAGVAVYQARIAQQRFQQVRTLSHRFIFDFNDQIRQLPGSTGVREMMVTTALEYLDSLSQSAGGDRELQWELAKAYEKVGDVQGAPTEPSLGHAGAALKSYRKAVLCRRVLRGAVCSTRRSGSPSLTITPRSPQCTGLRGRLPRR